MSTIRQIIHEAAGKCPVLGVDIKTAADVYPALVSVGAIDDGDLAIVVDGAKQRLRVLKGADSILKEIVCSTAADGFGNTTAVKAHGTTSTGLLKIGQIVGEGQPVGMEFKKLAPTGDIHKPVESGNHAAMTTRILTLKGLQPENESASYRGIYIHGTNREQQLGRPASGGCVRVSNADVMWLAENIPARTPVYILGNPLTTNPAFPSSDDCKPARAERQMSKERPKGDVSKKVPNKMKETAQPKISISEIRKMIRTELIREMQEEPVDLAYFDDVNDLPADMVDEVAPDDLEVLTALQERKLRLNDTSKKRLKTEVATPGLVLLKTAFEELQAKKLPENVESAVQHVLANKEFLMSNLGLSSKDVGFFMVAAIGVSGRETDFGTGTSFMLGTDYLESFFSTLKRKKNEMLGAEPEEDDPSLGPTQIKYKLNLGPGSSLEDFAKKIDVTSAEDLDEYPKAILSTMAMLKSLYDLAIQYDYSTDKPGSNPAHPFTSTGRAALDIAIVGYNSSKKWITYYCGAGQEKKHGEDCKNSPDRVKDYIPYLETDRGFSLSRPGKVPMTPRAGILKSTGYVGEVASYMKRYASLLDLF